MKFGSSKESAMPESAVPIIVAICAAFSLFIIVVGGVSVWTNIPDHKKPD